MALQWHFSGSRFFYGRPERLNCTWVRALLNVRPVICRWTTTYELRSQWTLSVWFSACTQRRRPTTLIEGSPTHPLLELRLHFRRSHFAVNLSCLPPSEVSSSYFCVHVPLVHYGTVTALDERIKTSWDKGRGGSAAASAFLPLPLLHSWIGNPTETIDWLNKLCGPVMCILVCVCVFFFFTIAGVRCTGNFFWEIEYRHVWQSSGRLQLW